MLRKEPGHWEMDLVVGAKGAEKLCSSLPNVSPDSSTSRFCLTKVRKASQKLSICLNVNTEQNNSVTSSKQSPAITAQSFLTVRPWNGPAAVPNREPRSIMLILFHHLNEAVTKTPTGSYAVSCQRDAVLMNLRRSI